MDRINKLLKQEITEIIQKDVKDPRIGFVTVAEVKTSKDLRHAVIFISTLEEKDIPETLAALERASGYIRHQLGERVVLKYLPELSFKKDETVYQAQKIENIIKKMHETEENNDETS